MILNYIEHVLSLVRAVKVCVPASTSLLAVPIEITNSTKGLKNCEITAWTKKYKSVVKKTKVK